MLAVRPRGLHLVERHILVDGRPVSASLFDFGLAFYHNAATLTVIGLVFVWGRRLSERL